MRLLIRAGFTPPDSSGSTPQPVGYGNSGNSLFAKSVYDRFATPENTVAVDGYNPHFASADEINATYDAFVLPFANAFRPQFENTLRQYTALIRRLRIPCVVIGAGAQAGLDLAELQGASMDEAVKEFGAAVLDRSATIGVRGEYTHAYLRRLGFDAVDIIGCPSLYYGAESAHVQKSHGPPNPDDPIAVNHAPTAGKKNLRGFAERVLETYPNSVYVAQEPREAERWQRAVRFTAVLEWITFMKTRRFSAGGRIHGNIAALLAGVPAVVLTHDSRTLELVRYHEIPYVMADMVSAATDIPMLYEQADFSGFNARAGERLARFQAFLALNGL